MEQRLLGKTGERLSVVGFGGIVATRETPDDVRRYVAEAIDRGVNYFDVAPTYGNAEALLGPALEPHRRRIFLACKTAERTAEASHCDLLRSLKRLRTDHVDLYQHHGVVSMSDVERILSPGGALETFTAARDKGLVRYLGFSAHDEDAACTLLDAFDFDAVTFPVNYAAWLGGNFGPRVARAAHAKGVGLLALKALAQRKRAEGEERTWPKCWYKPVDTPEEAALALRFTMSKGVTAAVSPSHAALLWWQCDAAQNLDPLTPDEEAHLAQRARDLDPVFTTHGD